jgi:hypothetical protein
VQDLYLASSEPSQRNDEEDYTDGKSPIKSSGEKSFSCDPKQEPIAHQSEHQKLAGPVSRHFFEGANTFVILYVPDEHDRKGQSTLIQSSRFKDGDGGCVKSEADCCHHHDENCSASAEKQQRLSEQERTKQQESHQGIASSYTTTTKNSNNEAVNTTATNTIAASAAATTNSGNTTANTTSSKGLSSKVASVLETLQRQQEENLPPVSDKPGLTDTTFLHVVMCSEVEGMQVALTRCVAQLAADFRHRGVLVYGLLAHVSLWLLAVF